MSSLPNEIVSDMTKFLPNDDITDLMLMSKTFTAHVTPRLKKIDQEMATMNQSIESFMPSPAPETTDNEWISQLNLKRFEPIGSKAKRRFTEVFEKDFPNLLCQISRIAGMGTGICDQDKVDKYKEGMSLERFDNKTFVRILAALVSVPEFRQEYNIPTKLLSFNYIRYAIRSDETFDDVRRIWSFYNENL
ncbi:hypothetical protein DdX_16399 [Ditylenchus destructor]|uniref:F-box domain-containing protein n=1 Tax=Ditylenchus destructor TaxID=166010 RepID=A0AAD4R001_9BILA|nr:hypothetical protein DdX_16399 [Ditylenchus destructor]